MSENETQEGEDFTQETEVNQEDMKEIFGSDSDEETEETLFGDVKRIKIPAFDKPQNSKLIYFKLPSTLSIEPTPFEEENYQTNQQENVNVIRWRRNDFGDPESNARIIKWSDGSLQLKVGDVYFDISEQKMTKNHLYAK
jgi:hypothetical protein